MGKHMTWERLVGRWRTVLLLVVGMLLCSGCGGNLNTRHPDLHHVDRHVFPLPSGWQIIGSYDDPPVSYAADHNFVLWLVVAGPSRRTSEELQHAEAALLAHDHWRPTMTHDGVRQAPDGRTAVRLVATRGVASVTRATTNDIPDPIVQTIRRVRRPVVLAELTPLPNPNPR
jgi:hypothetical protein